MKFRSLGRVAAFAVYIFASACFSGGASRFSASSDRETLARRTRIKLDLTSANLAVAQLTQIEADMASAIVDRDKAFFDRLDADEFLFTTEDGTVRTKADYIAAFDRSPAVDSYEIDELTVKASGEAGIVWGRSAITAGSARGEVLQRQLRFTHVFRRSAGRWLFVAAHESLITRSRRTNASIQ